MKAGSSVKLLNKGQNFPEGLWPLLAYLQQVVVLRKLIWFLIIFRQASSSTQKLRHHSGRLPGDIDNDDPAIAFKIENQFEGRGTLVI